MPEEKLYYKKDKGLIWIEVQINNLPVWKYFYYEDDDHYNDNNIDKPLKHTLGFPYELKRYTHQWYFRFTNPSDFKIISSVEIIWYQDIDGEIKEIYKWTSKEIEIEPESTEESDGQITIYPN